jgi:hypothetical protein
MKTETIHGPGGIRIELDSAEIFPDDPGQGTPAIVHLGKASATFWCAVDQGELADGDGHVTLSSKHLEWLASQSDRVDDFVEANAPGAAPGPAA